MPAYYLPFTLMPSSSLTKSTVVIMAIASGLAVGSNYLIQPLIVDISRYFSLSPAFAGYFVTLSQIAYALGLIFIVPLSDLLNNRRCVAVLFVCTALSMFLASLAPKLSVLLLGLAGSGLFCVAAMILVPYAATLAAPEVRSKTVGNVMTGLLAGILLARTISGAIAQYFGWRAVFFIIGLTMLIMAFVLLKALPDSKPSAKQSYFSILLSVWKLQLHDKVLRTRSILGAINFGLFSIFWTSITLLLSHTPYHYSVGTIGLFGLRRLRRFGRKPYRTSCQTQPVDLHYPHLHFWAHSRLGIFISGQHAFMGADYRHYSLRFSRLCCTHLQPNHYLPPRRCAARTHYCWLHDALFHWRRHWV